MLSSIAELSNRWISTFVHLHDRFVSHRLHHTMIIFLGIKGFQAFDSPAIVSASTVRVNKCVGSTLQTCRENSGLIGSFRVDEWLGSSER